MFVRVVRFTDVEQSRIDNIDQEVDEGRGPPEGVPTTGVKILHDSSQGTAVVLQYFETKEDMEKGAEMLAQMDPGDTPGTRASVDACEVKLEIDPS